MHWWRKRIWQCLSRSPPRTPYWFSLFRVLRCLSRSAGPCLIMQCQSKTIWRCCCHWLCLRWTAWLIPCVSSCSLCTVKPCTRDGAVRWTDVARICCFACVRVITPKQAIPSEILCACLCVFVCCVCFYCVSLIIASLIFVSVRVFYLSAEFVYFTRLFPMLCVFVIICFCFDVCCVCLCLCVSVALWCIFVLWLICLFMSNK